MSFFALTFEGWHLRDGDLGKWQGCSNCVSGVTLAAGYPTAHLSQETVESLMLGARDELRLLIEGREMRRQGTRLTCPPSKARPEHRGG